jgi:transcriptional regulator with XRE-family HTH domain
MAAYAAFVKRATERAKIGSGLSIEQIAERAGISANTIYLWRSGKGTKFPQGASVEAFCDALGIKPEVAFQILWPGSDARPAEPIPLGPDEDLLILARKLADPSTPERERFLIRETIRGLAARSTTSADGVERASKRRSAS